MVLVFLVLFLVRRSVSVWGRSSGVRYDVCCLMRRLSLFVEKGSMSFLFEES